MFLFKNQNFSISKAEGQTRFLWPSLFGNIATNDLKTPESTHPNQHAKNFWNFTKHHQICTYKDVILMETKCCL